jgi:hypothetical protein
MTRYSTFRRKPPKDRSGKAWNSTLNKVSPKREDEKAEREQVRNQVIKRAGFQCEYAELIPEVHDCVFYPPDRSGLEVDEMRGGSYRCTEYLDPDACHAACPGHHDWKTANKREFIERWEAAHE